MKSTPQKLFVKGYIYTCLALLCTFLLISLFELYMMFSNGIKVPNFGVTLLYKLINDVYTSILIGMVLFPFHVLFFFIFKKQRVKLITVFFVFVVVVQFALVAYSLTTLLNLGADVLGYSIHDVYATVSSSSEATSLFSLFLLVLFPMVFLILNRVLNKHVIRHKIVSITIILVVLFGSLKLVLSETSAIAYQNKMYFLGADIIKFQNEKNAIGNYDLSGEDEYPFLKSFDETKDVLAPFFKIQEEKPTIVILIIEGLGSEFVGDAEYGGFTPYLDSLASKSLYWNNFVSTSGRSFGILPSLLGSLPYGEKGFLELTKTPSHISLISVLKANGYTTSFYAGHQSSFDRNINFLEYNGIDYLIDENNFGLDYESTKVDSKGYSWGYPDAEIYKKALSTFDEKKTPRLDIVMTLTNHDPFDFPLKEDYLTKVDSLLNSTRSFSLPKEEIEASKDIYASLLYTDNSIKDFMQAYAEREEYKNTIFIITGDHRLVPISQKDKLCRYHVPMFIYSPLLKKSAKFKSVSSHLDVTPSLLSFLMNNYEFNKLEKVAWVGEGLDTVRSFRNIHQIPLMRYKGNTSDFIYKDYLYSDGELYKIYENFNTYKINDENLLKTISDSLIAFKKRNTYSTQQNKIFPDSLNTYARPNIEFSTEQLVEIKKLTKGLNFDQIFIIAREKAFNKERKKARLLCDYILNKSPNNIDARVLKGRVLAWEGLYVKAEIELISALKRFPYYEDTYLALLDLYWWAEQDEKSIALVEKAHENKIENADISFKLAKAFQRMNNLEKANRLMDSILIIHPENKDYVTFKQSLE
ncbi:MAG: sulfatase-like hydrolase/transferase [Flavobacteriales bacterium]|nr:sulfatase-like hydrolase/transferase [Flavobacteriales bacterium]